ncbi:NmrA/HSCARG family protein [Nocardia yamanashiensis]|uniref:NmrA/HSCARG family protein n=1 Tax=Nocardia yamanashiensis TaxID=209247 RepID=UPI0008378D47|nr:NmrA/HSCARG family protein [Nocardia yamanashiensis]
MTNDKGPILVIGATGRQGGAAARALLEKGWTVRAFVRNPDSDAARALAAAGAELFRGDLDDEDSLRAAIDGAYGIFLMLTMMRGHNISLEAVADEERHGKLVAELAAKAGITHFVYSSLNGVDSGSGIEYYDAKRHIEEHIRALGLPATMLRPVSFMDNFATFSKPVRDGDELVLSLAVAPDTPMPLIAIGDIGRYAALAFERPEEYIGRAVGLAGDVLTPRQIAETFGRAAGLPARVVQVPIAAISAFDPQVGKMFAYFNEHPESIDVAPLRAALPELRTLEAWIAATDWKL